MKRIFEIRGMVAILATLILAQSMCILVSAQERSSRTEEITWTWEVRPAHADANLPNVLLLGHSITRNYFPEVQRQLAGTANVYPPATSVSVGDPRLQRQLGEYSAAERVTFSVVHFNNGMHGWAYSEAEYRDAFSSFVASVRSMAPRSRICLGEHDPSQGGCRAWAEKRPDRREKRHRAFVHQVKRNCFR